MKPYDKEDVSGSVLAIDDGDSGEIIGAIMAEPLPDDVITMQALCRLFRCTERAIQRMIARRDLPPPDRLAGRPVWRAETLGPWLADAAQRKQAKINAAEEELRNILPDCWLN